MKKIYLLTVLALVFTGLSAAAQKVLLRLPANYEVSIDDRHYTNSETVNSIGYGQHTVKLYQLRPGILGVGKRRTLISTTNFEMRNNDVAIDVDQYGQMRIYETGYNNNQNGNRNHNDDNCNCQCKQGNGYGPHNNPGRGNKYGLYKNNKGKHKKHDRYDRDDRYNNRDRDDD